MAFAKCSWPIWGDDDLTECFRQNSRNEGPGQHWVSLAGLGNWLYVLALAVLQLVLPTPHQRVLKLRDHLTAIYAFQWLFNLVLFWSAITHPKSTVSQILTIVEFSLTSLLFTIAGMTRNGGAASLFSQATFSWAIGKDAKMDVDVKLVPDHSLNIKVHVPTGHPKDPWMVLHKFRFRPLKSWFFSFFSACLEHVPVLLLKKILECIKNPDGKQNIRWLFVILSPLTASLQTLLKETFNWLLYDADFRILGTLITSIYVVLLTTSAEEIGTIMSYMSIDAFRAAEDTGSINQLMPLALALFSNITLLWHILGSSSIPCLSFMIGSMLITYWVAQKVISQAQQAIRVATDLRLTTINETLQKILTVKLTGIDRLSIIKSTRSNELKIRQRLHLIKGAIAAVREGLLVLTMFLSFRMFTLVEKKALYSFLAFPVAQLFNRFQKTLNEIEKNIINAQSGIGAVNRLQGLLVQPETGKYKVERRQNIYEDVQEVGFRDAWFRGHKTSAFRLKNVNIMFKGGLNIIVGPTGSGKTLLIRAFLGEITKIKGDVYPEPGSTHVAYCPQATWLLNGTIQRNIILNNKWDPERYNNVLYSCALLQEMMSFEYGDQTPVGENGAKLSGGQKQRIALARAVYSNAKIVVLDEPFRPLDAITSNWISRECLAGSLMRGRTCILATNSIPHLVSPELVALLKNGKITMQGTLKEVTESEEFEQIFSSRLKCKDAQILKETSQATTMNGMDEGRSLSIDEHRAVDSLKVKAVLIYLKSMGPWWFWLLGIVLFAAQQLLRIASDLSLRKWVNQYDLHPTSTILRSGPSTSAVSLPDVDAKHSLAIYTLILSFGILIAVLRSVWIAYGSETAGLDVHEKLVKSILNAKLTFFADTPLGNLMDIFSTDLDCIDRNMAFAIMDVIDCTFDILIKIASIIIVIPSFLLAAAPISVLFFLIGKFYIKSSRDLKKLELDQKSPIFQLFHETCNGIESIRAFGLQGSCLEELLQRFNAFISKRSLRCARNRWLIIHLQFIGALVCFFTGSFAIYCVDTVDDGSLGLILSYAIGLTSILQRLLRAWVKLEQFINHLERVLNCSNVEQEAMDQGNKPSASWPDRGSMKFIHYTTNYGQKLVLHDITFEIKPGEKVGIVGKTGAGKTSLAFALSRGLEAKEGKIEIDGIDIASMAIRDLRERVSIVPQEPELFEGTIRSNLDGKNTYTDWELISVLQRVGLVEGPVGTTDYLENTTNIFSNLSTQVSEAGKNLSRGQRQLICLARALLSDPKILVLDEPISAIEVIRSLKCVTVINIAHRLETIIDYDKVLVLDKGKVVEYGHPHELLLKEGSFKAMCEAMGESEELGNAAESVYLKTNKKLVDVE